MPESILTSIKKLLGIMESDTNFDSDLIMDINGALTILRQLGVGPMTGFRITGDQEVWSDFIAGDDYLDLVKEYIHLKVRLMFDTSTLTAPMIEVINGQIREFEWRLNVMVESGEVEEEIQNGD